MIVDLAHVCLGASDLKETERFYCQGLGLRKAFDFIRDDKCIGFYLEVGKGRYIEVFHRDSIETTDRHPMMHVCFQVDDIDAVHDRLASLGISVTEKKLGADRSWQIWSADPSGVRIEFHQYTPDSSQVTGRDCILH